MSVTFINCLTVPQRREQEFIEKWDRGAAYVRSQPGFVSTSLHQSLREGSRYQYFTVAVWESAERFRAATSTQWWTDYVAAFGFGDGPDDFAAEPAVCQQIR